MVNRNYQKPYSSIWIGISTAIGILLGIGSLVIIGLMNRLPEPSYAHYPIQAAKYIDEQDPSKHIAFSQISKEDYEKSDKIDVIFDELSDAYFSFTLIVKEQPIHIRDIQYEKYTRNGKTYDTSNYYGVLCDFVSSEKDPPHIYFEWKSADRLALGSSVEIDTPLAGYYTIG